MKTPTKFVNPLTSAQRDQLGEIMKSSAPQRKRMRAHAILLSERRYSIAPIADIYQVDRDRVSQWLDWWGGDQVGGPGGEPRKGGAPQLTGNGQKENAKNAPPEHRGVKTGL